MSNQNLPWMICLRIGNHGVVGGSRHFPTFDRADAQRKRILASPSVRAQPSGSVGVLVMHYKKFQELVAKGEACTIARLKANQEAMPDLAQHSMMSHQINEIDTDLMEKWRAHVEKYS